MHVQIVTFNLSGISEEDYIDVATEVAPQFASMPGLLAKVWLEDPPSNVYGGIYFWEDRESMERFVNGNLFEGTNPEFAEIVAEDYGVLERLTRATQPVLEILEDEQPLRAKSSGRTRAAPAQKAVKGTRGTGTAGATKKAGATGATKKAGPTGATKKAGGARATKAEKPAGRTAGTRKRG